MGYRAHVQTKHEIEYGSEYFNWAQDRIHGWLTGNGVDVSGAEDWSLGDEWEMDKAQLRAIPKDAYKDIPADTKYDCEITAQDLREFVKELLDAPTGDFAYVSWF